MSEAQAQALVALLAASYPRERLDTANEAAYRGFLVELRSERAAREAVMGLIRTSDRLPTISQIRRAHHSWWELNGRDLALPEPDLTDEQRRENLSRIRRLAARVGRKIVQDS